MRRRGFAGWLFSMTGLMFLAVAQAQEFPARPIRIIVPSTPGGFPDVLTRLIAPQLGAALNQSVVVENVAGAGGALGTQQLIKSAPDGYTLGTMDTGKWGIAPALQPNLYDPVKDMAAVAQVTSNPLFLYISGSFPASNLREFIAGVKAKPGTYFFSSAGNGTVSHLWTEAFKRAYGLDMTHVPYKGAPEALQGVVSGEVQAYMTTLTAGQAQVAAGRLKRLASTGRQRFRLTPDLPVIAEAGASYDFAGDSGICAPAGTPRDVLEKLSAAVARATQNPDVVAKLEAAGSEVLFRGPDALSRHIKDELAKYVAIVKVLGTKAD